MMPDPLVPLTPEQTESITRVIVTSGLVTLRDAILEAITSSGSPLAMLTLILSAHSIGFEQGQVQNRLATSKPHSQVAQRITGDEHGN